MSRADRKQFARKMLSFFLSFAMVFSSIPSQAFADVMGEDDEVVAAEAAPEEEAPEAEVPGEDVAPAGEAATGEALPTEEVTPTDEPAPLAAAAPEGQLTLTAPAPEIGTSSTNAQLDNDALFTGYVAQLINDTLPEGSEPLYDVEAIAGEAAPLGTPAQSLTGNDLAVYQILENQIAEVAAGTRTSTYFEIPVADFYDGPTTWTSDDLGCELVVDGAINPEADAAIRALLAVDFGAIVNVLLAEHPYEMYWFEAGVGFPSSPASVFGVSGYEGNYTATLDESDSARVWLPVSQDYRVSGSENEHGISTTLDTSNIARAQYAVEVANGVVDGNENDNALDSLAYFKSYICDAVTYDDAAADDSTNTPYGDPWQLINVFDGDPNTNVVCEGYSKAFKYLVDRANIPNVSCSLVSGTMGSDDGSATGEGPHMWNLVNMDDGENYLVDVTNCDGESASNCSIGYPDLLFLVPNDNGDSNGYAFDLNGTDVTYTYDAETLALFTDAERTLATTSYDGPDVDDPSDEYSKTFTDDQGVEHLCYLIETSVTDDGGVVRILCEGQYEDYADGMLAYLDNDSGDYYFDPAIGFRFSVDSYDDENHPIQEVTYTFAGNEYVLEALDIEQFYSDEPIFQIPAGLEGPLAINVTLGDGSSQTDSGPKTLVDEHGVTHEECYRLYTNSGEGADVDGITDTDFDWSAAAPLIWDEETGGYYFDAYLGCYVYAYSHDSTMYELASVTMTAGEEQTELEQFETEDYWCSVYRVPSGIHEPVTVSVNVNPLYTLEDGVVTVGEGTDAEHAYRLTLDLEGIWSWGPQQVDERERQYFTREADGQQEYYFWDGVEYDFSLKPGMGYSIDSVSLDPVSSGEFSVQPGGTVRFKLTEPATLHVTTKSDPVLYGTADDEAASAYKLSLRVDEGTWPTVSDKRLTCASSYGSKEMAASAIAAIDSDLMIATPLDVSLMSSEEETYWESYDPVDLGIGDDQGALSIVTVPTFDPETVSFYAVDDGGTATPLDMTYVEANVSYDSEGMPTRSYEYTVTGTLSQLVGTIVMAGKVAPVTFIDFELAADVFHDEEVAIGSNAWVGSQAEAKVMLDRICWYDVTDGRLALDEWDLFEKGHEYVCSLTFSVLDGYSFGDEITFFDMKANAVVENPSYTISSDCTAVTIDLPSIVCGVNPWIRTNHYPFFIEGLETYPNGQGAGYPVLNDNEVSLYGDHLQSLEMDTQEEREAYRQELCEMRDAAYAAAGRDADSDEVWDIDLYEAYFIDDDGNRVDIGTSGYEELAATSATLTVFAERAHTAEADVVLLKQGSGGTWQVIDDQLVIVNDDDEGRIYYGYALKGGTIGDVPGTYAIVYRNHTNAHQIDVWNNDGSLIGTFGYYEFEFEAGQGVYYDSYPFWDDDEVEPKRYRTFNDIFGSYELFLAGEDFEFVVGASDGYEIDAVEVSPDDGDTWQTLTPQDQVTVESGERTYDHYVVEAPTGNVKVRISTTQQFHVEGSDETGYTAYFDDGRVAYGLMPVFNEHCYWVGYNSESGDAVFRYRIHEQDAFLATFIFAGKQATFYTHTEVNYRIANASLVPAPAAGGNTFAYDATTGDVTIGLTQPSVWTMTSEEIEYAATFTHEGTGVELALSTAEQAAAANGLHLAVDEVELNEGQIATLANWIGCDADDFAGRDAVIAYEVYLANPDGSRSDFADPQTDLMRLSFPAPEGWSTDMTWFLKLNAAGDKYEDVWWEYEDETESVRTLMTRSLGTYVTATRPDYVPDNRRDINDLELETIPTQYYTGSPVTPTVVLHDGDYQLVAGEDYNVYYFANDELGTGMVQIVGIGDYMGERFANFQIADGTVIASGTWGNCPWEINASGVLTIHPGTGAGQTGDLLAESPWKDHEYAITSVVFASEGESKVIAPEHCNFLFGRLSRIESVDLSGLDASNVKDMRYMFTECESLKSIDLTGLDLSSVTTMDCCFNRCTTMESANLSGLSLTSLDNMSSLFHQCYALSNVNLHNIETPLVTDMSYMFTGDSSLRCLYLDDLDTSSVQFMTAMFAGCGNLGFIMVGEGWSTESVANDGGSGMFTGCMSLVGGNGTTFDSGHTGYEYARIDAPGTPGYLTCRTPDQRVDIGNATVTGIGDVINTGEAIQPEPVVTYNGTLLVKGTDYTLSYGDNTEAGAGTVTIAGINGFKGSRVETFLIVAPLDDDTGQAGTDWAEVEPGATTPDEATVSVPEERIEQFSELEFVAEEEPESAVENAEELIVQVVNEDELGEFVIYDLHFEDATTGEPVPTEELPATVLKVTLPVPEGWIASRTRVIFLNTADGTATDMGAVASADGTTVSFLTTHFSNYALAQELVDISSGFTASIVGQAVHSGSQLTPDVTVTGMVDGQQYTLTQGTDFTVSYGENVGPGAGTGTMTITGQGSYTGTFTASFDIARNIKDSDVRASVDQTLILVEREQRATPSVTVTCDGETLTHGVDYELTYTSNYIPQSSSRHYRRASVTVRGIGAWGGERSLVFTLIDEPVDISSSYHANGATNNLRFNGSEQRPYTNVSRNPITGSNDLDYLTIGEDVKVVYENNVNAGTATATFTGMGPLYTGSFTETFSIASVPITSVTGINTGMSYNNSPAIRYVPGTAPDDVKRELNLKLGDYQLVEGRDYTVEWGELEYGTLMPGDSSPQVSRSCTITAIGDNFTGSNVGTTSQTLYVYPYVLTDADDISADVPDQAWTGNTVTPSADVYLVHDGERILLTPTTDYQLISSAKDVGPHTLSVWTVGLYRGMRNQAIDFNILYDLSQATIEQVEDRVYTGNVIRPNPGVWIGETAINALGAFTTTYDDNVSAGTVTATLVPVAGKSMGTNSYTFRIVPADASALEGPLAAARALAALPNDGTTDPNDLADGAQYITAAQAAALDAAIAKAEALLVTDNRSEDQVEAAVSALSSAAAIEPQVASVDDTALEAAIEAAEAFLEGKTVLSEEEARSAPDGTEYLPKATADAIRQSIEDATSLLADQGHCQNGVNFAVGELNELLDDAEMVTVEVSTGALEDAIAAARSDLASTTISNDGKKDAATGKEMADKTKYVSQADADKLDAAIAAAEQVLTLSPLTQDMVDNATSTLKAAQAAFKKAQKTYSSVTLIPIYRMYNTKTSEHLWTKSKAEYNACGTGNYKDWRQENIAWYSPNLKAPASYAASTRGNYVYVYRLYDKGRTGDHIYLTYGAEMKSYLSNGWVVDKGAGFWTLKKGATISGKTTIPIYRAYNPKLKRGKHHYTPSKSEYDTICKKHGWKPEGVKFYVIKK